MEFKCTQYTQRILKFFFFCIKCLNKIIGELIRIRFMLFRKVIIKLRDLSLKKKTVANYIWTKDLNNMKTNLLHDRIQIHKNICNNLGNNTLVLIAWNASWNVWLRKRRNDLFAYQHIQIWKLKSRDLYLMNRTYKIYDIRWCKTKQFQQSIFAAIF